MDNSEISNSTFKHFLRIVYDNTGVVNNKYQASQTLYDMKKEALPLGEELRYLANFDDGGNFGGSYKMISDNATGGATYAEWAMKYGDVHGIFYHTMLADLSTDSSTKAYMRSLEANMSSGFSGTSRDISTCLFGGKEASIGQLQEEITVSQLTGVRIKLKSHAFMQINGVNQRLVFATAGQSNKALPSSPLAANGAYARVTKILTNNTIEVEFQPAFLGLTLYVGDYIQKFGYRDGATAFGLEGFPDIIPVVHNDRDENDSDWVSYANTSFRGVTRSNYGDRALGQFVKAAPTGKYRYSDALSSLLKLGMKAGNRSSEIKLVPNDDKWDQIQKEIDTNTWQSVNGQAGHIGATIGKNDIAVAFNQAFTNKIYLDPYCWEDKVYMFRPYDFTFCDMGNIGSKVIDSTGNGAEGKAELTAVGSQGFGSVITSEIGTDKLFSVIPNGGKDRHGPLFEIGIHVFGNFKSQETVGNGVAVLD